MKHLFYLMGMLLFALTSCSHNATPPGREIITQAIVQDSSTLSIPITISNHALDSLLKSKIPNPLVNENKTVSVPVINAVTAPELVTTEKVVDYVCEVPQRVRVSWKCLFCPDCCFAIVMVKQACKKTIQVQNWVNKTIISKITANVPYQYMAQLNDIVIDGDKDTIHIHVTVDFRLKGDLPMTHTGAASCGFGEPLPEIAADLQAKIDIADDGQLTISNKNWGLTWNRPCNLTALDINVESLMNLPIVHQIIESKINDFVQNKLPNNFNLKAQLEKNWPNIAKPRLIKGLGAFQANIFEFDTRSIFISKDQIDMQVGALCRPVLDLNGDTSVTPIPPLPKLVVKNGNDSFSITLLAKLGIDKLSDLLNDELKKNKNKINSKSFQIDNIEIYQHKDSFVIKARIGKPFRGNVYLMCMPYFDLATNTICLGNLQFTTDSKDILSKYGAQLLNTPLIQDAITHFAKYRYDKDLSAALEKLKNFDQPLGQGLDLKMNLSSVSPVKLILSDNNVCLTAKATGIAALSLK